MWGGLHPFYGRATFTRRKGTAMTRLSIAATAIVLGAVTAVSGCGGGTVSKAGGATPPVTLTIGTDDTADRLAGTLIEEFARQVAEASDGSIVIEPVWRAAGPNEADWDQKVARLVGSGELDLGMIPARAWDTEGVSTLQALHAPFLIDSNSLVDAVVQDDVAEQMLAGLDEAGVTGLALVPESLRHPFSFVEPMLEPDDLDGQTIRAPRSDLSYAVLEAFGAQPTDAAGPGTDFAASILDGSITAAESSYDAAQHLPRQSVGTANITLYPKVQSLVANSSTFADLTDEQRQTLEEAAVETRTWAIEEMPTDAEAAEDFCAAGYQSVLAPQDSVEAWVEASRPVYDQLEEDPVTAQMIEAIRQLKESVTVSEDERPVACGVEAEEASPAVPAGENVIPDGTYRRDNSLEALMEAGLDEAAAEEYVGVLTFTLDQGVYTETPPPGATFPPCVGSYSSTETQLELHFETNCSGTLAATWEIGAEGLRLSDLQDLTNPESGVFLEAIFGGRPFTRID